MLDFMLLTFAGAMLLYWALWLLGCRLPGTGDAPFVGWRYANRERARRVTRRRRRAP